MINLKNKKLIINSFKWHFNYYILKKPFPLIAAFQLTNICNSKCIMCTIWQNPNKKTISLEDFKVDIDDLSAMGCSYISLSGGEPLTVKEIDKYVLYATKKIPLVNLVTNGFLLDEEVAKKLSQTNIDTISISIDALKEKHDEIRGVPGSFEKSILAIKNIKNYAPNIKIVVNTVISPWNIDDLSKLIDMVKDLGVYHKFQPVNNHPLYDNQKAKKVEYEITQEFIEKLVPIIKKLKKRKNVLNSNYFLSQIPNYFQNKNKKGIFNENCNLGYYYCDIRENNELYSCLNGMGAKGGIKIGNSLKQTFRSKEYKEIQKRLEKCRCCQKDFQICHLEPRITFPIRNLIKYKLFK